MRNFSFLDANSMFKILPTLYSQAKFQYLENFNNFLSNFHSFCVKNQPQKNPACNFHFTRFHTIKMDYKK